MKKAGYIQLNTIPGEQIESFVKKDNRLYAFSTLGRVWLKTDLKKPFMDFIELTEAEVEEIFKVPYDDGYSDEDELEYE